MPFFLHSIYTAALTFFLFYFRFCFTRSVCLPSRSMHVWRSMQVCILGLFCL
jgi:hypothetical protein